MRVELEGQAVMADVVGAVAGLGHGPERQDLDGAQLRLLLGVRQETVQREGDVFAAADGAHLVAQVAGELAQAGHFLEVGLVVDTVDESLGVREGLASHLAARGDVFRHVLVRQEHELLDEPVGFLGELLAHGDGLAVLVDIDLHFGAVEADGAGGETLLAQFQGQFVEGEDGFLHLVRDNAAFRAFAELFDHRVVPGVDDGLGEFIGEPVVGDDFRPAEPGVDDLRERGDLEHGGEGELLLVRAQGAQLVGEFLRQHGHGAVHQIDGGAAGLGLGVHRRPGLHVVRDVGDMDAHLVVAVVQLAERQGVVVVLGIRRVDGEGEDLPEVLATGAVLVGDFVGNGIRGVLHGLVELVRKAELRQDGVHLGVVLAGHAQHVHDVADGARLAARPLVHDGRDLHAAHAAFRDGDRDVVGHRLGRHEHPGLLPDDMENAHERLLGTFEDGDDLAAAAPDIAFPLLGDRHPHGIPVQGAPGLGGLDENVFLLSFDPHENEPFPGHHRGPHVFGDDPYFLLPLLSQFFPVTGPVASSFTHIDFPFIMQI